MDKITSSLEYSMASNMGILEKASPKSVSCNCSISSAVPLPLVSNSWRPWNANNDAEVAAVLPPPLTTDTGNAPFIVAAGITPASILTAQEASIEDMASGAKDAERKAQIAYQAFLQQGSIERFRDMPNDCNEKLMCHLVKSVIAAILLFGIFKLTER